MGLFWGHFGAYFGPVCIGKMGVFGLFWGHFGPGWGSKWGQIWAYFGGVLGPCVTKLGYPRR